MILLFFFVSMSIAYKYSFYISMTSPLRHGIQFSTFMNIYKSKVTKVKLVMKFFFLVKTSSFLTLHMKCLISDCVVFQDWQSLLQSAHHDYSLPWHSALLLPDLSCESDGWSPSCPCAINSSALLYTFCPAVLIALHLVYEVIYIDVYIV